MQILSLDHVAFNVSDPERSLAFYVGTLGLEPLRVEEYRAGTAQFPSVRINEQTIINLFPPEMHQAQPGGQSVNHIALLLADPPPVIEAFFRERGFPIVNEMTGNFGARGDNAHSFYVKDPDGNLIEFHSYE